MKFKGFFQFVTSVLLVMSCLVLGDMASYAAPVARSAAMGDVLMDILVVKKTNCDVRSGVIRVNLPDNATVVVTDHDRHPGEPRYLLDTNPTGGWHRYELPRQKFGSTRTWVIIAAANGSNYKASVTMKRRAKADCVATQNPRIADYQPFLNRACPVGTMTQFVGYVWVEEFTPGYLLRAGDTGNMRLVKKNGRQINGDGVKMNDWLIKYIVPAGRKARIVRDPALNSAWAVTSSSNVLLGSVVGRECVSTQ